MRTIDLFCGAGGLSLGLEDAGFESVLAVEIEQDAAATYSRIFPQSDLRQEDIWEVLRGRGLTALRGRIELVAGGAPCQPFSSGGKRLAQCDPRDGLPAFFKAVSQVKPPAFLLENVPGLLAGDRAAYLKGFITEMVELGYDVTWKVLNAADFGVPQRRLRLLVVGSQIGPFTWPHPTHGPTADRPYETVSKYLIRTSTLGDPNPSVVVYAKNPDLRPSPYDGHLFNGGGRPINMNGLCHTILASAGGNKTHFIDTMDEVPRYHAHLKRGGSPRTGIFAGGRRLTVAESAIIQTFPSGVSFDGSRSSQYTQVGNAVPPRLAAVIGRALADLLSGASYSETMIG